MGKSSDHHIVNMVQQLPPGFKFDPTDEELVLHFLYSKVFVSSSSIYSPNNNNFHLFIPELENFYDHYHPCQLHHGEAFESCGEWYFYTRKTENRISENGYWKEIMDMDEPIFASTSNKLVGFKKYFVFYKGNFPSQGVEPGWLMQEYHACSYAFEGQIHRKRRSKQLDVNNNWVLCRVQQISDDSQWLNTFHKDKHSKEVELSSSDEGYLAMEDDDEDVISCSYYNIKCSNEDI